MGYKFLEHTADIKFVAKGKSLNEAFESAILAFAEFVAKGNNVKGVSEKSIEVSGDDKENLLYKFLEELIYLLDSEDFVVVKGNVSVKGNSLKAKLFGDSSKNYKGLDHVKAATYADMYVKEGKKGWELQAVMDI